jgi:hypothetical protein
MKTEDRKKPYVNRTERKDIRERKEDDSYQPLTKIYSKTSIEWAVSGLFQIAHLMEVPLL